ncbi:hypothetical protein MBRA1_003717 [Malassezia brasiliensis]|uniref:Uncharacterized protein n=1 Tax=Malassezia brasiliensis TaxID=1821822 RepID=A0AAF0IRD1_9BASI|nr:hypothetical protein MBRA1_003717 [Malassezia brasiliensis]
MTRGVTDGGAEDDGHQRTVAWVPMDPDLHRALAQTTPENEEALAHGRAVPWRISNAYYDADVLIRFGPYADLQGAPAVLLLVRRDATVQQHRQFLAHLGVSGFALEVSLVIGVPTEETGTASPRPDVDEVYALDGWEYLDLAVEGDERPEDRIRDALMIHTWQGMKMHGPPGFDAHVAEENRDEFSDFVEAPPADMPTSDEIDAMRARTGLDNTLGMDSGPVIFDRLRVEMERIRALPAGPEKERQAALVALAVEQALME